MESVTSRHSTVHQPHQYSLGEEIANSVSHGLGAVLSVAALTLLVVFGVLGGGTILHIASAVIFGVSLVFAYTASTLYHSFPWPHAKHVLKIIDHAAIYLLIAGTYTPFMLVALRNRGGWWLFTIVWVAAIVGIAVEAVWAYRPKWLSVLVYLVLGWLAVVAIQPLIASLPSTGVWLLVAGGFSYTLGTIFYMLKRVRYMHMVWHLFVLGGSTCHFLSVLLYVLR